MSEYYNELLKSPLWQRARLKVMERDDFQCRFCGDKTEQLHVHHTIYLPNKTPWDYDDQYLVTICHACHMEEEKLKPEDPTLIGLFSMTGLSRRQLYPLAVELRRHLADMKMKNEKFQDLMSCLANV